MRIRKFTIFITKEFWINSIKKSGWAFVVMDFRIGVKQHYFYFSGLKYIEYKLNPAKGSFVLGGVTPIKIPEGYNKKYE